jgi:hypothetical protein
MAMGELPALAKATSLICRLAIDIKVNPAC